MAYLCTAPALGKNLLPEPCQEIRPVGLVMNHRQLVVATSGEVVEGTLVSRAKLGTHERETSVEGGARSNHDSISSLHSDITMIFEKKA